MTPGKYNMICPQGATFSKSLTWKIDDVPVNLTGYTARFQAKDSRALTRAPLVNITTENGGIILGGISGSIDLTIEAIETAEFYPKEYLYNLELISSNIVYRLLEGKFVVTQEVIS
jgi:hypothetical protein